MAEGQPKGDFKRGLLLRVYQLLMLLEELEPDEKGREAIK